MTQPKTICDLLTRSQTSAAYDLTRITRLTGLPYTTLVSPGLAAFYRLAPDCIPADRADLWDLAWAVRAVLVGTLQSRTVITRSGTARITTFPSFIHGTSPEAVDVTIAVRVCAFEHVEPVVWVFLAAELESVRIPRVLMIETDRRFAEEVVLRLRFGGFEAAYTATPSDALTQARTTAPDIIVLDIDDPQLEGLQLCQQIKAEPTIGHLPIVLWSKTPQASVLAATIEAAVCLLKPQDVPHLAEYLQAILIGNSSASSSSVSGART